MFGICKFIINQYLLFPKYLINHYFSSVRVLVGKNSPFLQRRENRICEGREYLHSGNKASSLLRLQVKAQQAACR